jgi:hypothetical protein
VSINSFLLIWFLKVSLYFARQHIKKFEFKILMHLLAAVVLWPCGEVGAPLPKQGQFAVVSICASFFSVPLSLLLSCSELFSVPLPEYYKEK